MNSDQQCVIIGASHAGVQAAQRVRRLGWAGGITLVGEEPHTPYHRPPLSKDLLKGEKTLDSVLLNSPAGYEKAAIDLRLGTRATAIDRAERQVVLATGESLPYDKLILAVGSTPRRLPVPGSDLGGVFYLRDAGDVAQIQNAAQSAQKAVIVGGGYIGLEVAASLRALGLEVTVMEAMERLLQRVSCATLSRFFSRIHTEEGVSIHTSAMVSRLDGDGQVASATVGGLGDIDADLVIVGIGILPNTELAEAAGLDVDNGILVDEQARTSDPDIYAIGDCASILHSRYGRRIRLESVQNANDQAITAARSICQDPLPYDALPWFWSDQYDVKLQIAGLSDGADRQLIRGDPETGRSFSILHLKGEQLLAVEAVNQSRDFAQGKKLIAEQTPLNLDLLADPACALPAAAH